jgi:hypothetical protein
MWTRRKKKKKKKGGGRRGKGGKGGEGKRKGNAWLSKCNDFLLKIMETPSKI